MKEQIILTEVMNIPQTTYFNTTKVLKHQKYNVCKRGTCMTSK